MYIYLQDFINLEFKRQHFVQKYFAWKGLMKKEFLHLVFFHSLISVKHNCMCKIIDSNTLFTKILKSRENVSYLIEKFYIRILKSAELFYSIQKLKRKKIILDSAKGKYLSTWFFHWSNKAVFIVPATFPTCDPMCNTQISIAAGSFHLLSTSEKKTSSAYTFFA